MTTHIYEGQRMADTEVAAPVVKVVSAWAIVGASSWAEFASTIASILAACYTLLLITEWFWVKFWRPIFEHKGWILPKTAKRKKRLPGPKK